MHQYVPYNTAVYDLEPRLIYGHKSDKNRNFECFSIKFSLLQNTKVSFQSVQVYQNSYSISYNNFYAWQLHDDHKLYNQE